MSKYYITKKGRDILYQKYIDIDRQINETNRLMGESVKMDNDLRENPDFMSLRVKAMHELPQQKAKLFEIYSNAIIIEEMEEYINFKGEKVILGSEVTIDFGGEVYTYKILGTNESNSTENSLSENAPLAEALLGKKLNDEIQFRNINIKILSIKRIEE